MAFNKKYAGLPDLDLAPDIYETPELTDDSTLPTATVRSSSPFQNDSTNPDIDRQRLQPDHARSQFEPSRVDARGVNFSDSIASKRRAYKAIRVTRKQKADGTEILGDLSDEEEDESLERKLARLRRETEELKEAIAQRKAEGASQETKGQTQDQSGLDDGVVDLSRALDGLHASSRRGAEPLSAEAVLSQKLGTGLPSGVAKAPVPASSAVTHQQSISATASAGLLSNAASFETRLTLLEAALGIPNTAVTVSPDDPTDSDMPPILPTLQHLSSQLSTLTSTLTTSPALGSASTSTPSLPSTTPHIEALTARIRKLTADAESLAAARQRAAEASRAAQAARVTSGEVEDAVGESGSVFSASATETDAATSEHIARIHALYKTLPTINSLHPLLPSVLDRLRSLRAIHAGAAQASEDMNALEQRQQEMRKEIDQWREGLKVLEDKVKESEGTMKGNMEVMGPWIKDLESRLKNLGA